LKLRRHTYLPMKPISLLSPVGYRSTLETAHSMLKGKPSHSF
jgi:hypothetical protein